MEKFIINLGKRAKLPPSYRFPATLRTWGRPSENNSFNQTSPERYSCIKFSQDCQETIPCFAHLEHIRLMVYLATSKN